MKYNNNKDNSGGLLQVCTQARVGCGWGGVGEWLGSVYCAGLISNTAMH